MEGESLKAFTECVEVIEKYDGKQSKASHFDEVLYQVKLGEALGMIKTSITSGTYSEETVKVLEEKQKVLSLKMSELFQVSF